MTYVLVGDVPAVIERYLTDHDLQVARVALGATFIKSDHFVVHVPTALSAQERDQLESWLRFAEHLGSRCALTSEAGATAVTLDLVFHQAVTSIALLNDGASANIGALDEFTASSRSNAEADDPRDAVEIGRFYRFLEDREAHRERRFESMALGSMAPFLGTVKTAILDMGKTSGSAAPPWNPMGSLTKSASLRPSPSLADVFWLHESDAARALLHQTPPVGGVAPHLLIRGESGSGKTMVADLVHRRLSRIAKNATLPLVNVNCAALNERNYEHDLFGCAAGAYTGIDRPVIGSLARASHGLVFLDEIGDLDAAVQRALLVFLQDGVIRPFQIEPFPGRVSVIAATNRDVPLMVERQQFRNDLNQRFLYKAEIPPLRHLERTELARLIDFTAVNPKANNAGGGLAVTHIAQDAMKELLAWEYSDGNFRELEGVVHSGIAAARRRGSKVLGLRDLSFTAASSVQDRDAAVAELVAAPPGPFLDVKRRNDLGRLAVMHGLPVLRTEDSAEYVVANGATYRWTPPARSAEQN